MTVTGKLYRKTTGTKIRKILLLLLVLILIQSVLGTMVRMYVDEISRTLHYEQREAWLADSPVALLFHRSFSWLVLSAVLFATWYSKRVPAIKKFMHRLTGIILLSMTTGIVLYYLDMPAMAQPLHLLLATLAVTQIIFLLLFTRNTTDLMNKVK